MAGAVAVAVAVPLVVEAAAEARSAGVLADSAEAAETMGSDWGAATPEGSRMESQEGVAVASVAPEAGEATMAAVSIRRT